MLYTVTQNVYYNGTIKDNYYCQSRIFYDYNPIDSKIYIYHVDFILTDNNGDPVTNPFVTIAGLSSNVSWGRDPHYIGTITFYVNDTEVFNFSQGPSSDPNVSPYFSYTQVNNIFIPRQHLAPFIGSFSISSLSDTITIQLSNVGYEGQTSDWVSRSLRFCTMSTPDNFPIEQTYEVKSSGIVGNSDAPNDGTGNIRLLYEIRHYNINDNLIYHGTPFSTISGENYLFYKLQAGRSSCDVVTYAKIYVGSDNYGYTIDYSEYSSGVRYLKVLVNNIDIIQSLRESIYNATSQSFCGRYSQGEPYWTGIGTTASGSRRYRSGQTYSSVWYDIFDNLSSNNYKIIPQGLYHLTAGTPINITLSCSNMYSHYGTSGGTQSGNYWWNNGSCSQFHVPLVVGNNNAVSNIEVPIDGCVYIHNGTSFDAYIPYIYNETNSTWEQYLPYIYNGTDWELQS